MAAQQQQPGTSASQFKLLYHSLIRARNLIILITEILGVGVPPAEDEALAGSLVGKRQRLE